jgi:ABC-type transporter Mla subunit MlaD
MTTARRLDSTVLIGVGTVAAALLFMVAAFTGWFGTVFSGSTHDVKAVFASTQQVRSGDDVRIHGITVGQVGSMQLDPGARTSTMTMALDHSAGPLYADARATVRWKLLLGGSFYVDLDRGTPAAGPLGSRAIPVNHTGNQVELEDVISFAKGASQTGLQTIPGELAKALRDAQPPTRALGTLADVAPSVAKGLHAVRGQQADQDLKTLVSASADTVHALDTANHDVRGVVAGAAATLTTTAARQADIQSTLAQAPGVLQRTDATLSGLDTTLGLADPLLARLHGPAADVAPTIASLHPTVVGADQLLRKAVPLLNALRPAVSSLASTARQGVPLLDGLTPSINRLSDTILPYLNEVDPETKHTTAEMIGPTMAALGPNIAGQLDDNGRFIRFPATAGSQPAYLPCQENFGNPDKTKLLECETLQAALNSFLHYNPIPGGSHP